MGTIDLTGFILKTPWWNEWGDIGFFKERELGKETVVRRSYSF